MRFLRTTLPSAVCAALLLGPLSGLADDTEVFFASSFDDANTAANVLFMFDNSGSMANKDGDDPYTRMTRLKQAMLEILDTSEGVNIGMGSFNGSLSGGAILYPSVDPDSDVCPDAACEEIRIAARVREPGDDAFEALDGSIDLESRKVELTLGQSTLDSEMSYTRVLTSDDNVVEVDGSLRTGVDPLTLFHVPDATNPALVGLRFVDLDLPAGATVLSAEVDFSGTGFDTEGDVSATISMDASLDMASGLGSPPFADVDGRRLSERPRLGAAVDWFAIPAVEEEFRGVTTPNIARLVEARIAEPDWAPGDALALIFELRDGSTSDAEHGRTFKSFDGGSAPLLAVEYTTTPPEFGKAGVRFSDVAIPRGATITHATMEFQPADWPESEEVALVVSAEDTGHAPTFTATSGDISRRTPTTARTNWQASDLYGFEELSTENLAAVVQEIVDRGDWCGGNAIALLIEGKGYHSALSRDRGPWKSPVLRVGYDPRTVDFATTCTRERTVARVTSPLDDGEENPVTSVNTLDTSRLVPARDGDGRVVGLRFDALDVARGADISSAYLTLRSAGGDDLPLSLDIRVAHASGSAIAFDGSDGDIGGRATGTGALRWDVPTSVAGEPVSSPDIGALVAKAVDATDWATGEAIVLTLTPVGGDGGRAFAAFEGSASRAPKLEVNTRREGTLLSGVPRTLRSAREDMMDIVLGLHSRRGTPLVDAYYESIAYLLGRPVDYGKRRGDGDALDRLFRTSTPLSWSGGDYYSPPGCSEVDPSSVACIGQYVPDGATYDAPATGSCQANQIVLLSDGEATTGEPQERIRDLIGATSCKARPENVFEECAVELAEWLLAGDPAASRAPILTHTVGFNFTSDFLREVAEAGGGKFQEASTASDLAGVFRNIVDAAATLDTSFVAPAATVSQFNRLANRNDVYFAMFRPSLTTRWDGNLKRYEINKPPGEDEAVLVDALVKPAIDPTTGEFADGSRSFWTDGAADGADVAAGGAANELALPRKLLTYVNAPTGFAPLVEFGSNNATISALELGIDPLDITYRKALLDWASGIDVLDVDGDGDVEEVRYEIGDPMHSSPLVMNYADTGEGQRSYVYLGTNEGYLHAIDTEDGTEKFGFIPPELYGNLDAFFTNRLVQRNAGVHDRPYGLDGEVSGWHEDLDRDGLVDENEKAYLYFGMRRGGRNYYALDVSKPDAPSLAWVIRGGTGEFSELGQTWSTPIRTRMRDGQAVRDVLVFGAGYDTGGDTREQREAAAEDAVGRGLYVVDAKTGERLAHVGPTFHSDLDYAMPSTVRVVDIDLDGLADMFWIGDTGGRLWRFDIETGGDDELAERIRGSVAADFGSVGASAARRFHYPPDVTLVQADDGEVFMNVGIGSGWRAHPLDTTVEDRFYMLRTTDYLDAPRDTDGNIAYPAPVTEAEMFDASSTTTNTAAADEVVNGWYLRLPVEGEKVIGEAVTVAGQVLFTSYLPGEGEEDSCSVSVGGGRLYALDAITAAAVIDLDGSLDGLIDPDEGTPGHLLDLDDRSRRLRSPGIPAPISVLLPESANPPGANQVTLDVRAKGEQIDIGSLPSITRTYWAEHGE